jgi:hypothetical protein
MVQSGLCVPDPATGAVLVTFAAVVSNAAVLSFAGSLIE